MKLERSLELLKKIKDGKDYNKEYQLVEDEPEREQLTANNVLENLSLEDVALINGKIKEMQNSSELYQRKTEIHGKKHIENVMLFAMIISSIEKLNAEDRSLLIEAAMLHDQGRVNDEDQEHGIESAYYAGEYFADTYSADEIKIIQAAIMFHDDRTKCSDIKIGEDIGFLTICDNLNLSGSQKSRARVIGNMLKDADALDRARFVHDTCPIDERYLRTNASKQLIMLAMELHEAYAAEELSNLIQDESEEDKKMVESYAEEQSPIRAKKYYLRMKRENKEKR